MVNGAVDYPPGQVRVSDDASSCPGVDEILIVHKKFHRPGLIRTVWVAAFESSVDR